MKVALLDAGTGNIGDYIQSFAVQNFLNGDPIFVPREDLVSLSSVPEPTAVVMNGWFMHKPETWPPGPNLRPVFFGFHVAPRAKSFMTAPDSISYFKQHEPIGCRDEGTAQLLDQFGVKTFLTGCATYCLEARANIPSQKDGTVFIVDLPQLRRHNKLIKQLSGANDVQHLSHEFPQQFTAKDKLYFAEKLLSVYKHRAYVVLTRRLHCALPCAAMRIPVLFFGNRNDYRLQILPKVGVPIHDLSAIRGVVRTRMKPVDSLLNWTLAALLKRQADAADGIYSYNASFKANASAMLRKMIDSALSA